MAVVDPARVLNRPTRPNWALNLSAGALIGILGGVLIGFARESLDSRIHAIEDLRGMTIATSVSFIPEFGSDLTFRERAQIRKLSDAGATEMYLQKRPRSPEAEALRSLGSCLMLARASKSLRVILVTSSLPREGKSTLAVNFASALSRHGKTCLVDADLRAPKVAKAFGIAPCTGLSDLLAGQQTIHLNPVAGLPNLMVLTAGKAGANRYCERLAVFRRDAGNLGRAALTVRFDRHRCAAAAAFRRGSRALNPGGRNHHGLPLWSNNSCRSGAKRGGFEDGQRRSGD